MNAWRWVAWIPGSVTKVLLRGNAVPIREVSLPRPFLARGGSPRIVTAVLIASFIPLSAGESKSESRMRPEHARVGRPSTLAARPPVHYNEHHEYCAITGVESPVFVRAAPLALRVATAHLTVLVLLACPFVCLSGSAEASAPSPGSHSGCDCCPRPAPGDADDCPGKPDPCQGSGTCLCHGAVLDRPVAAPHPGHEILGLVPRDAVLMVRDLVETPRGVSTERTACHFPAAESGRAVRALIASLLL